MISTIVIYLSLIANILAFISCSKSTIDNKLLNSEVDRLKDEVSDIRSCAQKLCAYKKIFESNFDELYKYKVFYEASDYAIDIKNKYRSCNFFNKTDAIKFYERE